MLETVFVREHPALSQVGLGGIENFILQYIMEKWYLIFQPNTSILQSMNAVKSE